MTDRIRLTYAFDAYCGWCYGLGPALRQFADGNADRIELRVLSGGLFSGPRALPVAAYPHIPTGAHRLGGPLSSALQLTEALDRHLTPTSA
ncbi:hypothetical protein [Nonomuraea sp. NPDC005650]|uniref:hypothetical protein n=1 Tax=Nonomuraea sp. NPDC005650 TaxID=3157045 RepID=UPI0033BF5A07